MFKRFLKVGMLVLSPILLAACGGGVSAEAVPADQVPVVPRSSDGTVVAEAVIEPAHWRELSFEIAGRVADVLVQTGDSVSAGDPLLRLETDEPDRADLELSVQMAEQDVALQQAALDQLLQGASEEEIARAERENANQVAQAEVSLRLKQRQLEKAQFQDNESSVAAARARLDQVRKQREQTLAQDPTPDVTIAQVEVERTQTALDDAQTEYDESLEREWEKQEVRDGYARALRQARWNHQQAQAELTRAQNALQAHQVNLQVLDAQIDEAEALLAQELTAQETYSVTLQIQTAEIEAAQLELQALQGWENPYLDEPSEAEVAQAQARLRQAEVSLKKAELALSQYEREFEERLQEAELQTPMNGTVVDVRVQSGDLVSAGQVVLVVATLDQWQARTTDLTELDAIHVMEEQEATITVDALSEQEFAGRVRRVALQSGEYRGDVTYAVTIDIVESEASNSLRWGMTAMVRIETN